MPVSQALEDLNPGNDMSKWNAAIIDVVIRHTCPFIAIVTSAKHITVT